MHFTSRHISDKTMKKKKITAPGNVKKRWLNERINFNPVRSLPPTKTSFIYAGIKNTSEVFVRTSLSLFTGTLQKKLILKATRVAQESFLYDFCYINVVCSDLSALLEYSIKNSFEIFIQDSTQEEDQREKGKRVTCFYIIK